MTTDAQPSTSERFEHSVRLLARRQWAYLIILCAGLLTFLPNLGNHSLWDVDEAHNAECAREMWEAGHVIVPTFNYALRTDKPAMLYWWIEVTYSLFGVNEWAARLPSALAAIGSLLVCYEIARRLFGSPTGLLSSLILASSFMFAVSSHAVTPDAILILMVQLTFLTWIIAYDRRQPIWLLLCGCCAGLAMLTKGPVGVALPGAVIVGFLFWQRDWRFLWNKRSLQAVGMCLLTALPWYLYVGYETHWEFLKGFLLTHNVSRFSEAMEGHRGPFFYHLAVILLAFAPWSIFLGPTIWNSLRHRAINQAGKPWAYRLLLLWIGVWFVVFSIAATKLPNYVLPTYPPLAMLTASFLVQWWKQRSSATVEATSTGHIVVPGWLWKCSLACFILLGLALLIALPVVAGWVQVDALANRIIPNAGWLMVLGAVPIVAGLVTWLRWSHHEVGWGIVTLTAGSLLLTACLGAFGPPAADASRANKSLALSLNELIANRDVRVTFHPDFYHPSLVFYVQREITRCKNQEDAVDTMQAKVPTFMFVTARHWPKLSEQLGGKYTIHDQRHDFTAGQDILLISNQVATTQHSDTRPLSGPTKSE